MRRFGTGITAGFAAVLVTGLLLTMSPTLVRAEHQPAASQVMSRERVIALAEKRYKARVVRADLSQDDGGRRIYQLRLLSDQGKIWTVRVDAATGDSL